MAKAPHAPDPHDFGNDPHDQGHHEQHQAAKPTPAPKPAGPATPATQLDGVRDLSALLRSGDRAGAFRHARAMLDAVFDACEPAVAKAAPLATTAVERAEQAAKDAPLASLADRLDEFCQHCEGGTGHPVARSFAGASTPAGAGGWGAQLLAILMQILQAFLQQQQPATKPVV